MKKLKKVSKIIGILVLAFLFINCFINTFVNTDEKKQVNLPAESVIYKYKPSKEYISKKGKSKTAKNYRRERKSN